MRKHREKENSDFNVWRSYSDMMAGVLLLFVLIMCVTLFQSQINYEQSIKERDEKLFLQEEYTKEIMSQKNIVENQQNQLSAQDEQLATQDELLAAQKKQLDELAAKLAAQQEKLDAQSVTLASQQSALDEKTTQLADQQARIDKIIGVKADVIEALRQEFANNNVNVAIDASNGSLVMDSSVLFAYDETELTEEGQMVLGTVLPTYCNVLLQEEYFPYVAEIIIDGYTDSSGGYEYNLELSQRRSLAVAEYLLNLSQSFLSGENQESLRNKLTVNGHSSSNPILDEDGNEDADASRRVEVKFRLKDEEMIEELRSILDSD
ncbi:MAG: OmpA family protein [Eubacteriales bacterium]|nr:OmpA family protein [Eubacteriales bacterium]